MFHRPADPHFEGAERVVRRLQQAGHQAVLAGGCVRDLLLGRAPQDYDVATSARPAEVEALFEESETVGRRFGVCQVHLDGRVYEVATFRREWGYSDGRHPDGVEFCDGEEDARRRDFTVNAMFYDPVRQELTDYVGGLADLRGGLIRAVGDPEARFREDHLRLLRAVRFAVRMGFAIEADTRSAIERMAALSVQVSAERLREELRLILTGPRPADALRLMDRLGMLRHVFPELEAAKGCEQPPNYHPEGDVFVHSLLALEKLPAGADFELALGTLFHDIGKPQAVRNAQDGWAFPNHWEIGARIAEGVCRRLKLSNQETERVGWLVRRHMYFMDAPRMKDSTLKKLFAEPGFEQLAELHRADALASWGNLDNYHYVLERRRTMPPEVVEPPRLVTGDDLKTMGYSPGPLFRRVLETVRDAQLDGEVMTREQALELLQRTATALTTEGTGNTENGCRTRQKGTEPKT
jgi:putative nucleotidyltransferase with HDIG domain